MYPNPQEALPLPPRPSLEQYKKRAKDLVEACRKGDPNAIRDWAVRWTLKLAERQAEKDAPPSREQVEGAADKIAQFARAKLSSGDGQATRCALADAQFVIARAHGFASWPKLAAHLESLARTASGASAFEAAVGAIVSGEAATLTKLLRRHPKLARARSAREHNATLLHYVSANGVEGYRQKSPRNAGRIAELLLQAGAEVDAQAEVYGGPYTALGLVATSAPPAIAGVQREVIDVLLAHGARMDLPAGGRKDALVRNCLANGQPEAAEYLASRGAPLDLPSAAGLGRIEELQRFVDKDGKPTARATMAQLLEGFSLACAYGRANAVAFLLERGLDADVPLKGHGDRHTGLHLAALYGHASAADVLLQHGANVDAIDETWRTPPLVWALTGWTRQRNRKSETQARRHYEVVARLVAAGAKVTPDILASDEVRSDRRMLAALRGKS